MQEMVLAIGTLISCFGSLGNGMYQIIGRKSIHPTERAPLVLAWLWLGGGLIAFFAGFYLIIKAYEPDRKEKVEFEPVTYTVYKKK